MRTVFADEDAGTEATSAAAIRTLFMDPPSARASRGRAESALGFAKKGLRLARPRGEAGRPIRFRGRGCQTEPRAGPLVSSRGRAHLVCIARGAEMAKVRAIGGLLALTCGCAQPQRGDSSAGASPAPD